VPPRDGPHRSVPSPHARQRHSRGGNPTGARRSHSSGPTRSCTSAAPTTRRTASSTVFGRRARNLESFVAMRPQDSLVHWQVEREPVPLRRPWGLDLLSWSPLASGFLSGKYRKELLPPEGLRFAKGERLHTTSRLVLAFASLANRSSAATIAAPHPTAPATGYLLSSGSCPGHLHCSLHSRQRT
jgi:hypothetical protein